MKDEVNTETKLDIQTVRTQNGTEYTDQSCLDVMPCHAGH